MEYYLDMSPMLRALTQNPKDFEMDGSFVRHRPSRHLLRFKECGNAQLIARCNCTELPISREQSNERRTAVAVWREAYWQPLVTHRAAARRAAEINREFANHFRSRGRLQRAFDALLSFLGKNDRVALDQTNPSSRDLAEAGVRSAPTARNQDQGELLSA